MGRRSRGGTAYCVQRRWSPDQYPFAGDPARGMAETWCGERTLWDRDKPFRSPKLASCLKCAQAIGKAALAKNAGRLRLERRETPLAYDKSTYDVWIDGVLRAHVGIANGWGEKWYLAKATDGDTRYWTNGRHGGVVSGSVVDYYEANRWLEGGHKEPERISFWPVHFNSRDAMAVASLHYLERFPMGLPTPEEAAAREAERKENERLEALEREAARVEREAIRAKQEEERQERVATWRLALESLEGRGDLSNVERAGLEAIKRLYPA